MPDFAEKLLMIAECDLCDDAGMRPNGWDLCDHIDYAAIAARHLPAIKEALKRGKD